jgi:hypothetical protein
MPENFRHYPSRIPESNPPSTGNARTTFNLFACLKLHEEKRFRGYGLTVSLFGFAPTGVPGRPPIPMTIAVFLGKTTSRPRAMKCT